MTTTHAAVVTLVVNEDAAEGDEHELFHTHLHDAFSPGGRWGLAATRVTVGPLVEVAPSSASSDTLYAVNDALTRLGADLGARAGFASEDDYDDALNEATHQIASFLRLR